MKKIIYLLLVTAITACNSSSENTEDYNVEIDSLSPIIPVKINRNLNRPARFNCLKIKAQQYKIDPANDTTLVIGTKGSKLHIPSYAFVDKEGCMITDRVTIEISDYKSSADMALSGIPMTYTDTSGVEYNFNSAGMVDIRGYYKDEPIEVAANKILKLDYALARKGDDINFYALNDSSKKWTETQKIKTMPIFKSGYINKTPEFLFTVTNPRNMNYDLSLDDEKTSGSISLANYMNENYKLPNALKKFLKNSIRSKYKSFTVLFTLDSITGKLINIRPDQRNPIKRFDKDLVNYVKSLPPCLFQEANNKSLSPFKEVYQLSVHRGKWTEREVQVVNNKVMTHMTWVKAHGSEFDPNSDEARAMRRASIIGQRYPDIVRDLSITGFGIYNCDQIYRLKNKVEIVATYFDENGIKIEDGNQLSLINLAYNAAFSFHPSEFACDAKGNNVLLIVTESKEIYILDKGKFQAKNIIQNGNYSFNMRRVTDEFTSSEKLAVYLGIEAS